MSIGEVAVGSYGAIQKARELDEFLDLIKKEKPRTIVEIGTKQGGTLYAICQAAPDDALIISMDSSWETYALAAQLQNNAEYRAEFCKPTQTLNFLHADSHDDPTLQHLKNYLAGADIDLLFLDGDHTYKGVKKDWTMYSPLVREGGIVAFHDIVTHTDNEVSCHVDELWQELQLTENVFEIFHDDREFYDERWGGIGIVYIYGNMRTNR